MSESLIQQKSALRKHAREALAALTPERRQFESEAIRTRLASHRVWVEAGSVLLFAPRTDEPDIWPLVTQALADGKRVSLPRYRSESQGYEPAVVTQPEADMAPGKFGILEPKAVCNLADLNRLDLVLVPGLAFDRRGFRLGRGKGYYDRLLAAVSGRTCGVAFDVQLISAIPVEPHDVRLNCIMTPTHWLEFQAVRGG
jgi:5-formyltetrahydrofolate cyclo-ligase